MATRKTKQKFEWHGCMYCGKQQVSIDALALHFAAEHRDMTMGGTDRPERRGEDGRWECRACDEKFLTPEGLEHHTLSVHQAPLPKFPSRTGWKDRTSR